MGPSPSGTVGPVTPRRCTAASKNICWPCFGPLHLDQLSVSGIEKFRDDMRKLGRSPVTINGVIHDRGVFKMAMRRGPCAINPVDRVERAYAGANGNSVPIAAPTKPRRRTVLAPNEICIMLEHAERGL